MLKKKEGKKETIIKTMKGQASEKQPQMIIRTKCIPSHKTALTLDIAIPFLTIPIKMTHIPSRTNKKNIV